MKGEKNIYQCTDCCGVVVTIDRDEGVTPFMIDCKATKGCTGIMESHFYRCDQMYRAEFEWYRPGRLERLFLNRQTKEHFKMGGLILRKARR